MSKKPTYEELEQKISKSQALFHAVIESAEDSIFIKNHQLKYTLVNPAMERLFGLPASQLLGKSDEELFGDEAGAHIREIDSCVLNVHIFVKVERSSLKIANTAHQVYRVEVRGRSQDTLLLPGVRGDLGCLHNLEGHLAGVIPYPKRASARFSFIPDHPADPNGPVESFHEECLFFLEGGYRNGFRNLKTKHVIHKGRRLSQHCIVSRAR